ncbi:MAG TPA: alpha/beta fold hydrolase [Polyangiaceae bacterium]|nr:alpha/beta fold hydrolase [Polyangiaceae bacterium]
MALPVDLEQLIGGERLALLREVALMPRDLGMVVPDARPGDDVVVLVHGFLASAGVFRPLRSRLERETSARVATFTHAPCVGVRRIARQLADLIDQIPHGTRITVVGHSLGGVVARWYVQEMGGHARVRRTVSLAAPFRGVDVPQFLVGVDLCARSALLRRVRERAHLCGVPHTSVVAGADTTVVGVETACLGYGDVFVAEGCGHNALLFHEQVASLIIARLHEGKPAPPPRRTDALPRAW